MVTGLAVRLLLRASYAALRACDALGLDRLGDAISEQRGRLSDWRRRRSDAPG